MKLMKSLRSMTKSGESVGEILKYWLPEMISSTILFSLTPIVDSHFIASLGSLSTYGALGTANNLFHTLIKFAESIPVASMAVMGRHNGSKDYEKCGEDLGDTFWTTFFIGFLQFVVICFAARHIFWWLGVSEKVAIKGAPFLQLKSLGIMLIFISLALIGFMKSVKNTRVPMLINIVGIGAFIFFDYALIFGHFGFPQLGLNGSAIATIIQYATMNVLSIAYIIWNPDYKKYFARMFFSYFSFKRVQHLLNLSWPIMVDKTTLAMSYVWLSKMLAPMGTAVIATYDVVKNLERFAFLPAIAFAQIIVFLVSNRLGTKDYDGAISNVKKVLILTSIITSIALLFLCMNASFFISCFDPKNKFTDFASFVLQIISVLVVFDFIQLVLAGALRGAGDVRSVMWGRFFSCFFIFIPVSYAISKLPIQQQSVKFLLIYGTFYLTTAVMGIIFLMRIRSHKWEKTDV